MRLLFVHVLKITFGFWLNKLFKQFGDKLFKQFIKKLANKLKINNLVHLIIYIPRFRLFIINNFIKSYINV